MSNKVREWTRFFKKMFDEVKKAIFEHYRLEEDGSGSPEILAIREIAGKFPCPVRIAEVRIDIEKYKHIEDELCQIVRYDFSQLGIASGTVEYCGVTNASDVGRLSEVLVKNLGLEKRFFEDFRKDFTTIGFYDDEADSYVQFSPYDIKNNPSKFVHSFLVDVFDLVFEEKIRRKSGGGIDWNSKFSLKPDPILTFSETTRMDKILSLFSPFSQGAGIEKLHEDICDIQLIPNVPEDVKSVFRHAKDLYVYGFFRYSFFTIAQHYAYLALESAIKNRYYQSFDKTNTLTNEKNESVIIGTVDHQTIRDFCNRVGWNVHKLRINGERFALTTRDLLDWLVKKKIINVWERKQCKTGMDQRNHMSHLTRGIIITLGHSSQAMKFAADLTNRLYSK